MGLCGCFTIAPTPGGSSLNDSAHSRTETTSWCSGCLAVAFPSRYEVASRLVAPLDVFLVRKLGVPGHTELAMGAIAPGGVEVLNHDVIVELGISAETVAGIAASERLGTRSSRFRVSRRPPDA